MPWWYHPAKSQSTRIFPLKFMSLSHYYTSQSPPTWFRCKFVDQVSPHKLFKPLFSISVRVHKASTIIKCLWEKLMLLKDKKNERWSGFTLYFPARMIYNWPPLFLFAWHHCFYLSPFLPFVLLAFSFFYLFLVASGCPTCFYLFDIPASICSPSF